VKQVLGYTQSDNRGNLSKFTSDVVVVGGAGHIGLPLAIMFASKGLKTIIYDISEDAVTRISFGDMPFLEPGAEPLLRKAISNGNLVATSSPDAVRECENVVFVIGTPVDEHLNPDPMALSRSIEKISGNLSDDQLIVLRSTIFPGVTAAVGTTLRNLNIKADLAFCPERIAEHNAVEELVSLPQIVSGTSESAVARAKKLFTTLTPEVIVVSPEEAELAKLFTNTWRYIKFAIANQFFMMANDRGLDYEKIREAIRYNYPRANDLPSAGFAAGPCLFKDTMQLAAFSDNKFALGHTAMLVNEGLPLYIVTRLEVKYPDLANMKIGILGMAFKGESDDIRSSLSYKLKKILEFKSKQVLCADPYVASSADASLLSELEVLTQSDLIIIATPHKRYRDLYTIKPVIDIWNIQKNGVVF
jgi:UDP-N-acetyl-D-mannosaminuronic acid dehydrogenase